MRKIWHGIWLTALLAGCSVVKPVPQEHHYRLVVPPPEAVAPTAASLAVAVVEPLRVAGVYSERAISYSSDADDLRIEQYHYELWAEPPAQLLQQALIDSLRAGGIAQTVASDPGRARVDLRVSGRVKRLVQRRSGEIPLAVVAMELRADSGSGTAPLVVREYIAEVPAENSSMDASIRAFGLAAAQVNNRFLDDLRAALRN